MTTLNTRLRKLLQGSLLACLALAGCRTRVPSGSGSQTPARGSPANPMVQALQAEVRTGHGPGRVIPTAEDRQQLRRLYDASGYTPLWLTGKGALRGVGQNALARLLAADSEGLQPEDYNAAQLDSLARRVAQATSPDPEGTARLDAGLSLSILRYLRHLHVGRVNPKRIGLAMDPPRERHDYTALLSGALQEGSLDEVAAELSPPLALYGQVREALAKFRGQVADSLTEQPLALAVPLKPGQPAAGLDALARRLVATGDLAAAAPATAPARYTAALAGAVSRFQERHGLTPDSVLGKETLEELNVPLAWRAHQLELTLERLRWLGDLGNEPFILVNIPMFELTAWSSPQASGPPLFRSGVIVGKALDTETPVFIEEMRYLVFQPFWNIPPSIARDETIPAIEKDRAYFSKNHLEIVRGQGDDADPVALSDDALERVAEGQLRIRQRPGPDNSLGAVKFVFPNDANVYLHGTPAEELFDRSRRDFSHGCVRVEDPVGLAEWVLSDRPEWSRGAIVEAMQYPAKPSRRVSLSHGLTVVLFYITATVEQDGRLRFARDIYGHDRKLDEALHLPAGD